jgi:hypothetical protein
VKVVAVSVAVPEFQAKAAQFFAPLHRPVLYFYGVGPSGNEPLEK